MNLHQKKKLLFVALIVLFLLAAFLNSLLPKEAATSIIVLLFIVYIILHLTWWKCPHCNRSLGRLEHDVTHCKYCGNRLYDDDES